MTTEQGFTVVELIIIIIIIGILSVYALSSFDRGLQHDAALNTLENEVRSCQFLAMTGIPCVINFTPTYYQTILGKDYTVSATYINAQNQAASLTLLNFDKKGAPYDSVGKPITLGHITVTLTAEGQNFSFNIAAQTGMIYTP